MTPEPVILLKEDSPHGNLDAIVEQDERVAYLYVWPLFRRDLGVLSCWLRNLAPAPEELDRDGMKEGIAPMQPRAHCNHPRGKGKLDPTRLRLVWFPEGDGMALLEDGKMLAVIPAWSFNGNFPGYSCDAIGESTLAWGLEDDSIMQARIRTAARFWRSLSWKDYQSSFLDAYARAIGRKQRYFAIDGGKWPERALVQANHEGHTYLLTLGISQRPQPQVEMYHEEPGEFRRIEFAACFSPGSDENTIGKLSRFFSDQSDLPWNQITFLGHGHTISCDIFADDPALQQFSAIMFVHNPPGIPSFELPRIDGDRVLQLWTVPITEGERQIIREKESAEFISRFPGKNPIHVIAHRPTF